MQTISPVTTNDLLAKTQKMLYKFEVKDDAATWINIDAILSKKLLKSFSFSVGGPGESPNPIAGSWSASIANPNGMFSPLHPTSEYADLFRIGREVRISLGGLFKKFPAPFEAWSRRKLFALPIPTADLVDFPVEVPIIADADIGAECLASGYDIRFTAANGTTLLPYERESFAVASGEATGIFWVKSNVAMAGTYIWCYYGNASAADGADPEAVWDTYYKAVYHMNDATTSTILDSTSNNADGAKTAANGPTEAAGKIAKGQDFDAVDDHITATPAVSGLTAATLGLWIKQTAQEDNVSPLFIGNTGADGVWGIRLLSSGGIDADFWAEGNASTPGGLIPLDTWYHVAITFDSTTKLAYFNGVMRGTATSGATAVNAATACIGGNGTWWLNQFSGLIDEVRLSSIARSAAWIAYEYANMNPAGGGLTWGAEETPTLYNYTKYWQRMLGYMDAPSFDFETRSVSISGFDRMKRLTDTLLRWPDNYWGAVATFDSKAGGGGAGTEIYDEADACEIGAGEANNVTSWVEGGSGGVAASVASTKSTYALSFTRDVAGPTSQYCHNANVGTVAAGAQYTVKFWGKIAVGSNYATLNIYQTVGGVATLIGQQNISVNENAWRQYSLVVPVTTAGALQLRLDTSGKYATGADIVHIDQVSVQVFDPDTYNIYELPIATCNGPYYVTLDNDDGLGAVPLFQGDDATDKQSWMYAESTGILTFTRDILVNAHVDGLGVYYYIDTNPDNVVADLLANGPNDVGGGAGLYATKALALSAMNYTPTGILIPRVWFEAGTSVLAAIKLICERCNYRFWFDEIGTPCFQPASTDTPPAPPAGVVYYVDQTGGLDANDGLSVGAAWKTVAKVNATALAIDDQVLFKRGETWAEQFTPTFSGTSGHPIILGAYGVGAPPIISGGTRSIDSNAQSYITCRGIVFSGKEALATGSTGFVLEYCIVRDSTTNGFKCLNSTAFLVNCLVIGSRGDGVLADGAASIVDLKNTIVIANGGGVSGSTYGGGGLNTANGGTINYSYSDITGNGYKPSWNIIAGTGGSNNLLQVSPRMERPMKDASFFTMTIDDSGYAYAQDVAAAIAPYGGKLTFFVIPSLIDAAGETALAALAAAGHEIAVHSWSHADLTSTSAFDVTSVNTAPTVDVDVATTTITLWCDEVGNRVTFNWAGDKTIADLKAAVVGKGWTVTNKSTIQDTLRLASLADSGGAQAMPPGPELVLNGGFDSGAENWTPMYCTLASIAGGQSGNCLEMTATVNAIQLFWQYVEDLVTGEMYEFSGYVKSGTSGDEAFRFHCYNLFDNDDHVASGTSSGTWTKYSHIFIATGADYRFQPEKFTATAGTMLFDTVSLRRAHAYTALLDVSAPNYAFWDQEVNVARDWITAVTGIAPKTMSYPFGLQNAALKAWLCAEGYEGARGTDHIPQTLNSIELYNNRNCQDILGDGTEAGVKAAAIHFWELCTQTARMFCDYCHNTGELSPAQWGWLAEELADHGALLQTFGSYVAAIRASHTPDVAGLIYTKTYPDVFNPHLSPSSPCINVGFSVGLDEDIEGTPTPQAAVYDIGPYEFPMTTPATPTFENKHLKGVRVYQDLGTVRNRITIEGIEQGMFATREEKASTRLTGTAFDQSSIDTYLEKAYQITNHLYQDQASLDAMAILLLYIFKDPKLYADFQLFANPIPLELSDVVGLKLLLQKVGGIEYFCDRTATIRDASTDGPTTSFKVEIEP